MLDARTDARTESRQLSRPDRTLAMLLVALLVVLNAADLLSTHLVLARGGEEGNPLVAPLIEGLWPAALAKCVVLVAIALLALRSRSTRLRALLVAVDVWYLFVVCWNIHLLSRL